MTVENVWHENRSAKSSSVIISLKISIWSIITNSSRTPNFFYCKTGLEFWLKNKIKSWGFDLCATKLHLWLHQNFCFADWKTAACFSPWREMHFCCTHFEILCFRMLWQGKNPLAKRAFSVVKRCRYYFISSQKRSTLDVVPASKLPLKPNF